jgi:hypothetical protein
MGDSVVGGVQCRMSGLVSDYFDWAIWQQMLEFH